MFSSFLSGIKKVGDSVSSTVSSTIKGEKAYNYMQPNYLSLKHYTVQLMTHFQKENKTRVLSKLVQEDKQICKIIDRYQVLFRKEFQTSKDQIQIESIMEMVTDAGKGCSEMHQCFVKNGTGILRIIFRIDNLGQSNEVSKYQSVKVKDGSVIEVIIKQKTGLDMFKTDFKKISVNDLSAKASAFLWNNLSITSVLSIIGRLRTLLKPVLPVITLFCPLLGQLLSGLLNMLP